MPLKHKDTKSHKSLIPGRMPLVYLSVFVFLWQSTSSLAQEPEEIQFLFTQTDTSYTFDGSFKLVADPECLLAICFNPDDLIKLAPDAKGVTLTGQGDNWNQLRYTYRKFLFFENTTLWQRQLDEEKLRVDFSLVRSENNRSVMPEVRSSSGFYQINPENDHVLVEYYQSCIISNVSLSGFYIDSMKKEAIRFLLRFLEYAHDHCKSEQSGN
ncbi:MAG: hypothetical protein MUC31_00055 [Bacteroidales bacterium]|jgi:hypothetical protein|nr:hypothetical protein [Bacteroidales bacterium]